MFYRSILYGLYQNPMKISHSHTHPFYGTIPRTELWLLFFQLFQGFFFILFRCPFSCQISVCISLTFFKPRKLFKWVYFRLQSIWLAQSKCRALEIDDPFFEFIALIRIRTHYVVKLFWAFGIEFSGVMLLFYMYIKVSDQARLFEGTHRIDNMTFLNRLETIFAPIAK